MKPPPLATQTDRRQFLLQTCAGAASLALAPALRAGAAATTSIDGSTFVLRAGSKLFFRLVAERADLPVLHHAAADVRRDLRAAMGIHTEMGAHEGGLAADLEIVVQVGSPPIRPALAGSERFLFRVAASGRVLEIIGSDLLGAVWGLYHFSERYLGVHPFHPFLGRKPDPRERLEVGGEGLSASPRFALRGWFFNDEDYITGWRPPAGERAVEYLFYKHIISHETTEEVIEAALRNRMNFLVPCSFLDIDVPGDRENVRLIAERGLAVSQHHIEPLGVSHFSFRRYFAARGKLDAPASYFRHPELFDEIWRHYVRQWHTATGGRVVWQLGLRGDVDRAVWKADPTAPNTPAEAGRFIARAISHQWRILREETGEPHPRATVTLWGENSDLFAAGHLQPPAEAILVFANEAYRQKMKRDFATTPRTPGRKFGVYHHTGYYWRGPHAAQGHPPAKSRAMLATVAQKGDTAYALNNVQCLRELMLGAWTSARATFHGFDESTDDLLREWCERMLPAPVDTALAWYRDYFAAFAPRSPDPQDPEAEEVWLDGELREIGLRCVDKYPKGLWERSFNRHPPPPEKPLSAADQKRQPAYLRQISELYPSSLAESARRWRALRESFESHVQPGRSWAHGFFVENIYVQAAIMEGLSAFAAGVLAGVKADRAGDRTEGRRLVRAAAEALAQTIVRRKLAERGKFRDWYANDNKFDLQNLHDRTLDLWRWLEPPPAERRFLPEKPGTGWDYINNYQFGFGH